MAEFVQLVDNQTISLPGLNISNLVRFLKYTKCIYFKLSARPQERKILRSKRRYENRYTRDEKQPHMILQ